MNFTPTGTVYGPLLNFRAERDALASQMDEAPYKPTVFADVDNRMKIAQDEIFGPVACLIPFKDEADAIRLANDIQYGLSSYVWTENIGKAHRVAAAVEAGMCFVNSQNVRDLRKPFGGTKASGTGREGGTWSYEVFCEPKNVAESLGNHHIPHWGV
jgi:5-carboxymethyl-2-hydroxymuconic-semialdehyde dehydrogenase